MRLVDVGVAPGAILRSDAHIDEVALDQHHGVDDVLIGADDGEEGAIGRRNVDLADRASLKWRQLYADGRMTASVFSTVWLVRLTMCTVPSAWSAV